MYKYDNPRNGDLPTRVINHFLYKVGWSKSQQKLTNMDVDNNHIWIQTRWPLGPMLEKDPSQGGWASCWRPILIVQNGRTLVTWVHLQHVDNWCMIMCASTKAMRFQNAQNPRGQTNQQEGLYWHLSFSGTCTNKILANKWQKIRHFSSKVGHTTPKTPQAYDGVWRSNPSSYRKGNSQSVLLFLCWGSIGNLNLWRNITHLGSRARKISLDDKNMWYFKLAWSICRAKQFLNTSSLDFSGRNWHIWNPATSSDTSEHCWLPLHILPGPHIFVDKHHIWLVLEPPLWKMMDWKSFGMMTFPRYWKIKFMFQTTNQQLSLVCEAIDLTSTKRARFFKWWMNL